MAGSIYGNIFRISTFGESHGIALGVVIDGCPSGLKLDTEHIHRQLQRRKPGQSAIVTQRKEDEEFEILSGVFDGKTTGTPIAVIIRNKDQKSKDYSHIADKYRPSHADYTYTEKYGVRDYRGGGRSSARETVARVIAGAIAQQVLSHYGIQINAFVSQVGEIKMGDISSVDYTRIEDNIVRCPDEKTANRMINYIKAIKKDGDSVGGVITCIIDNCPVGLGSPVFDKLHAELGKAMLSINAVKGFEYGSGFRSVSMLGSEHNDVFENQNGRIVTKTNHSGGIQGGISNGMPINMNIAFKPVATIMKDQNSVDDSGNEAIVKGKGRHDPCVVPRAVPIVEAMASIVILDALLLNKTVQL